MLTGRYVEHLLIHTGDVRGMEGEPLLGGLAAENSPGKNRGQRPLVFWPKVSWIVIGIFPPPGRPVGGDLNLGNPTPGLKCALEAGILEKVTPLGGQRRACIGGRQVPTVFEGQEA